MKRLSFIILWRVYLYASNAIRFAIFDRHVIIRCWLPHYSCFSSRRLSRCMVAVEGCSFVFLYLWMESAFDGSIRAQFERNWWNWTFQMQMCCTPSPLSQSLPPTTSNFARSFGCAISWYVKWLKMSVQRQLPHTDRRCHAFDACVRLCRSTKINQINDDGVIEAVTRTLNLLARQRRRKTFRVSVLLSHTVLLHSKMTTHSCIHFRCASAAQKTASADIARRQSVCVWGFLSTNHTLARPLVPMKFRNWKWKLISVNYESSWSGTHQMRHTMTATVWHEHARLNHNHNARLQLLFVLYEFPSISCNAAYGFMQHRRSPTFQFHSVYSSDLASS